MFANSQQEKYKEHEVQGQDATVLEWRVAVALDKLELPYMFQFDIEGGSTRRGGVILDFLILIPPLSVPAEVMSGYWHRSSMRAEDRLKEALVRQKGTYSEMVYWWEADLQTIPDAYQAVKRELRV